MGLFWTFECDGDCGAKERGGADFTKPPTGWRAIILNGETFFACSVACGVKAIQEKLLLLFKRDGR
jgi:hypothetical protein